MQVPGETPGPATSALAGASSTAGLLLSLVFNPERGSIPSYILTFIKEHDYARRKPVFCWNKLCRVFSLDHRYGGTPGTGGCGSHGLTAGPACTAAQGTKPHLCWWAPCVELLLPPADVQSLTAGEEQHQWGLC